MLHFVLLLFFIIIFYCLEVCSQSLLWKELRIWLIDHDSFSFRAHQCGTVMPLYIPCTNMTVHLLNAYHFREHSLKRRFYMERLI